METMTMSAEKNWSGGRTWPGSGDAVLRHPNGSIDIGAYVAIAHRQRTAAITSSMLSAVRLIRKAWAAITVRRPDQQATAGNPAADVEKMDGKLRGIFSVNAENTKRSA